MNPVINKFLVALVTVLGAMIAIMEDGITNKEWVILAILALNAIGVYAIPNAVPPEGTGGTGGRGWSRLTRG